MNFPHTQNLRVHITSAGVSLLDYLCSGFCRGSELPAVCQYIYLGSQYTRTDQKRTSRNMPSCLRRRKISAKNAMLLAEMLAAIT